MSLPDDVYAALDARLAPVDAARAAAYPGERSTRQPVHTCYVPADAVVPASWPRGASRRWPPSTSTGCPTSGSTPALVEQVLPRVREKLAREPVEDLRVDSEDGYRGPPDREDDDVRTAAAVLAAEPALPPFWAPAPSRWRRPRVAGASARSTCSSPAWRGGAGRS